MNDLLLQGINAARAGQRDQARELLTRVVQEDERNEQAWLWLSGVVDDPEDMRVCLENVLDLNPENTRAQQGLAWLEQRYGPRVVEPPAQEHAPESRPAHTTTTRHLELPAETVAPPPAARPGATSIAPAAPAGAPATVALPPAKPAPAAASTDSATLPCPYCGAPTVMTQDRCTQCRNSLLVRTDANPKRSGWLTTLAALWGAGGLFWLLFAGLILLAEQTDNVAPVVVGGNRTGQLLGIALVGLIYLSISRGLFARRTWAYIVNIVLQVLVLIVSLCQFAAAAVVVSGLLATISNSRGSGLASALLIGILLLVFFIAIMPIVLTVLSYRDFFGPKVRLAPEVANTDQATHYNNGVSYKDRGMWYMAAKEWEAAVLKAPRDLAALHALGLAYAQLKQFDQARATLDRAIQLAPDNTQLAESRAIVDNMAAKA